MKKSILFTQVFILISALIWFSFTVIVATGLHPALPDSVVYRWIMAGLSFLSAVFLLTMLFLLSKKKRIGFFLTIPFLILIAILTIADDLGLIDFIVLFITVMPIILLIKDRKWYLTNQSFI